MLCCITFLLTSLTTEAYENIVTGIVAQHSESYGSFQIVADDFERYAVQWNSIKFISPGYTNYDVGYRINEDSRTGIYHISMPIYIPIATVDDIDTNNLSLNDYYCIAPWVAFSGITPSNCYLSDEAGHVFSMTAPQGATAQTPSPNGSSFWGKGSGVFYKGIDLATPFYDTASGGAGNYVWGKYLYLNFELSNATVVTGNVNLSVTCWLMPVTDSVNTALQNNTTDKQTQNLINQQNNLQQQTIDKQTESNTIAQDNADTNKDTNNKITSFFNSFFDNLIGVFVPESGFFSQWFSSLNDFMAQKLGFLWSPFDFLISFLNGVYSGSGSASLVFPELAWIDGTVIIPRTEFSFDNIGGESFHSLRDMIYFATDVILLGAVISQFYKKIKLVFEGGGD